jgi:hypothetical protein
MLGCFYAVFAEIFRWLEELLRAIAVMTGMKRRPKPDRD